MLIKTKTNNAINYKSFNSKQTKIMKKNLVACDCAVKVLQVVRVHSVLRLAPAKHPKIHTIHTIHENEELDNVSKVTSFSGTTTNTCDSRPYSKHDLINMESEEAALNNGWTTLTPQEISMWIDKKARCLFTLAFLAFNIFFWTFVYAV